MAYTTQELQVPLNLRLNNLQNIINELQEKLGTLKVGSKGFKDVESVLGRIRGEMDKLQVMSSKPFTNQRQFVNAERSVEKIEDGLNRAQLVMSRIKFSDLQLDAKQTAELQAFNAEINNIKNNIKNIKEATKQNFFNTDIGKSWLGIDPNAINDSLQQITNAITKAFSDQKKAVSEAEVKLKEYENALNLKNKINNFASQLSGVSTIKSSRTIFQDVYDQIFNAQGKFQSGGQTILAKWLSEQFQLDETQVASLVQGTASKVIASLKNGELQQLINNKLGILSQSTTGVSKEGLTASLDDARNKMAQLQPIYDAVVSGTLSASNATKQFESELAKANAKLDEYKAKQAAAAASSSGFTSAAERGKQALISLKTQLQDTETNFLRLERTQRNFQSIRMLITNFMGFTQVLNLTKRAIRSALNHIKELDSVMNKIAIVTDMTTSDLWKQVDAYSAMAQKYGVSIKGAYEVSQIYYQQGLKTNDVLTLTNETLKLAKISGLSYASTTDYMTTALRGFKMEMSEASTIVDVYSNLAAHTAVTQEELAVAMSKTASSLDSVGASFEQSSAMIATMVAVTRESATNIGSALKSIAARYGEMKSDPTALVDSEGEAMAYNKVDAALQSVGITLKDTSGQFRNFYDVIYELAEIWDTLESTQQRYIATQFAGNRQQSRFLALVSNKDLLKANLEYAEDSEDVGTIQTLKSLDTVESKLEQVRVAYQQFYTTIGADEAWKGILDGLKNFINTLNSLPKIFNNKLPIGALGMLMDVVNVLKSVGMRLLTGVSTIWSKMIPDNFGAQQGAKIAQDIVQEVLAGLRKARTSLEEAGREAANSTAKGAGDALKDQNTAAGKIQSPQQSKVVQNTQVVSEDTVSKLQSAAGATQTIANNLNQAANAAKDMAEHVHEAVTATASMNNSGKFSINEALANNTFAEDLMVGVKFKQIDFVNDTNASTQFTELFMQAARSSQDAKAAFAAAGQEAVTEYAKSMLMNSGISESAAQEAAQKAAAAFQLNQWFDQNITDLVPNSSPEGIVTYIQTLTSEMLQNAREPLSVLGENLSISIAQGMIESQGVVGPAAATLATNIISTLRNVLDMHSPSPTIIAMFENGVGDAIAIGLTSSQSAVIKAAERLGLSISDELREALGKSDKINLSDYFAAGDARNLVQQAVSTTQSELKQQLNRISSERFQASIGNAPKETISALEAKEEKLESLLAAAHNTEARIQNVQYEKLPVDYVVGAHNFDPAHLQGMTSWGGIMPSPSIAVKGMLDKIWSDFGNGSELTTAFMPRKYVDPTLGHTQLYPGDAYTPMLSSGMYYPTALSARQYLDSQPEIGFDFRRELGEAIRDATHIPDISYLRKILQNSSDLPFRFFDGDKAYRDTPSRARGYLETEDDTLRYALRKYVKDSGFTDFNGKMLAQGAQSTPNTAFAKALYDTVDLMRKAESSGSPLDQEGKMNLLRDNLYTRLSQDAKLNLSSQFKDEAGNELVERALKYTSFLEKYPGYDWAEAKSKENIAYKDLAGMLGPSSVSISDWNDAFFKGLNPKTTFIYDYARTDGPIGHETMARYMINNVPGIAFNENGPLVQGEAGTTLNYNQLQDTLSSEKLNLDYSQIENIQNMAGDLMGTDIGQALANSLNAALSNIDFTAADAPAQFAYVTSFFSEQIRSAFSEMGMGDIGRESAGQLVDGLSIGLSSKVQESIEQADSIGQMIISGLNRGLGVHSPSIYAIMSGKFIMLGLEEGLTEQEKAVLEEARKAGRAVIVAMDQELAKTPQGFEQLKNAFIQQINDIKNLTPDAKSALQSVVNALTPDNLTQSSQTDITQAFNNVLAQKVAAARHALAELEGQKWATLNGRMQLLNAGKLGKAVINNTASEKDVQRYNAKVADIRTQVDTQYAPQLAAAREAVTAAQNDQQTFNTSRQAAIAEAEKAQFENRVQSQMEYLRGTMKDPSLLRSFNEDTFRNGNFLGLSSEDIEARIEAIKRLIAETNNLKQATTEQTGEKVDTQVEQIKQQAETTAQTKPIKVPIEPDSSVFEQKVQEQLEYLKSVMTSPALLNSFNEENLRSGQFLGLDNETIEARIEAIKRLREESQQSGSISTDSIQAEENKVDSLIAKWMRLKEIQLSLKSGTDSSGQAINSEALINERKGLIKDLHTSANISPEKIDTKIAMETGKKAGIIAHEAQAEETQKPLPSGKIEGAEKAGTEAGEQLTAATESAYKPPNLSNTPYNIFDENGVAMTAESITEILEKIGTVSEESKQKLLDLFNSGNHTEFINMYNSLTGSTGTANQGVINILSQMPPSVMPPELPNGSPSMQIDVEETKAQISSLIEKLTEVGVLSEESGAKLKASLEHATPNELIHKLGELEGSLEAAGSAGETAAAKLQKMNFSSLGSAIRMLGSLTGLSKQAKGAIQILGGVITALGLIINRIDKQSKSMAASNPWMAIAMAVLALVNGVSMLFETTEQRIERLTQEVDELNDKAKEVKANYKTLESSVKKLDELKEKRYDSAEATEEYQTSVDELAEKFPELVSGFDEAGNAIIEAKEAEIALGEARRDTALATLQAAKKQQQLNQERIIQATKEVFHDEDNPIYRVADLAPNASMNASTQFAQAIRDEFVDEDTENWLIGSLLFGGTNEQWIGNPTEMIRQIASQNSADFEPFLYPNGWDDNSIYNSLLIPETIDEDEVIDPKRLYDYLLGLEKANDPLLLENKTARLVLQYLKLVYPNINPYWTKGNSNITSPMSFDEIISQEFKNPETSFGKYLFEQNGGNLDSVEKLSPQDLKLTLSSWKEWMTQQNKWTEDLEDWYTWANQFLGKATQDLESMTTAPYFQAVFSIESRFGAMQGALKDAQNAAGSGDTEGLLKSYDLLIQNWNWLKEHRESLTASQLQMLAAYESDINNLRAQIVEVETIIKADAANAKKLVSAQLTSEFSTDEYILDNSGLLALQSAYFGEKFASATRSRGYQLTWEDWLASNSHIDDKQWSTILHESGEQMNQFWQNLLLEGQNMSDEFVKIISSYKNYRFEDLDKFTDIEGWTAVMPLISEVMKKNVEEIQNRMFSKIQDFHSKHVEMGHDFHDRLLGTVKDIRTLAEEQFMQAMLAQYDKLYDLGYITEAESYGTQALDIYSQILQMPAEIRNTVLKYIEDEGINTKEGIDRVIKKVKASKTTDDDVIIGALENLKETIYEALLLTVKSEIEAFTEDFKNNKNLLSKLTSGIEISDVEELISSTAGKSIELTINDFIVDGNKLILTAERASQYIEATYATEKQSLERNQKRLEQFNSQFKVNESTIEGWDFDDKDLLENRQLVEELIGIGGLAPYIIDDNGEEKITDIPEKRAELLQLIRDKYIETFDAIQNYDLLLDYGIESLIKSAQWKSGNYSSLKRDFNLGENDLLQPIVEQLLSTGEAEIGNEIKKLNTDFSDNPDVKNAIKQMRSKISTFLSDGIAKGIDNIDLTDYEGLPDWIVADFKAEQEKNALDSAYKFARRYASLLSSGVEESNNMIITALEKDNQRTSTDAIKDLTFFGNGQFSATTSELKNFVNTFGLDLATLFDAGLVWYDNQLGEFIVNYQGIIGNEELSLDLENVEHFQATVKDSVNSFWKNLGDLIKKGLSGTLTNLELDNLKGLLTSLHMSEDEIKQLQFTETAEGLKLSTDSAILLYTKLRAINSLQGKLIFNELSKSLKESNEHYRTASANLARIDELSKKIQNATESGNKAEKARIEYYQQELDLARQIAYERATTEDSSYDFMSGNIPGAQNNPLNYWGSWGSAFKTLNDSLSSDTDKGLISYKDFFNMVTEMGNIAVLSGESIEFSAGHWIANAQDAADLIREGAQCLTVASDGSVKIDLSKIGFDFSSGAESLEQGVDSGIKKMAESQVDMLDEMIKLMETIVAMEQLGELDVNADNMIDLEEMFHIKDGQFEGVKQQWRDAFTHFGEWLDSDAGKDAKEALQGVHVSWPEGESDSFTKKTVYEILTMTESDIAALDDAQRERYNAIINAYYNAAKTGDFSEQAIMDSITSVLLSSGYEGDIDVGDIHLTFHNGVVLTRDANNRFVVDNITYSSPEAAAQAIELKNEGARDIQEAAEEQAEDAEEQVIEIDGEKVWLTAKLDVGTNEIIIYTTNRQKYYHSDKTGGNYSTLDELYEAEFYTAQESYSTFATTVPEYKIEAGYTIVPKVTDEGVTVDKTQLGNLLGKSVEELQTEWDELGSLKFAVKYGFYWDESASDTTLDAIRAASGQETTVIDAKVKVEAVDDKHAPLIEAIETGAATILLKIEADEGTKELVSLLGNKAEETILDESDSSTQQTELQEASTESLDAEAQRLRELEEQIDQSISQLQYETRHRDNEIRYRITDSRQELVDELRQLIAEYNELGGTRYEMNGTTVKKMPETTDSIEEITENTEEATTSAVELNNALQDIGDLTISPEIDNTGLERMMAAANSAYSAIQRLSNMSVEPKTDKTTSPIGGGGGAGYYAVKEAGAAGNIGLAKAQGTLMGELGPELVVSNGRYFVAGQNGAEFVNLDSDAIVFNHLQTKSLLNKGMSSSRGRAITNEKNAVAYARGSVQGGPAMVSARQALNTLKQLKAQWQAIANMGAQDLAGLGGSGGGGGGDKSDPKAFVKELEIWYNWLQRIAVLEQKITYEQQKRQKIQSDMYAHGQDYARSNMETLAYLREQAVVSKSLYDSQQAYFEKRRAEMNAASNPFSALYTFDEYGQLKYQNGAFQQLAGLSGRDKLTGQGNYTAADQYAKLVAMGFEKYMQYDSSGNKIDTSAEDWQVTAVQAFWDKMDADKEEMQSLHDSIEEHKKAVLEKQEAANQIMREIEDNQISVEDKVLKAIIDTREREIDELQKQRDAIEEASNNLINGLSEQLDKEKEMYSSQQNQDELTKLQRQLGILQRSGGSASQIANLQKEISQKQQDAYFDAQQKQIDALQEASDNELKRLDNQIELMKETLEYEKENGLLWQQVYEVMSGTPEQITEFIMTHDSEFWGQSPTKDTQSYRETLFEAQQFKEYQAQMKDGFDAVVAAFKDEAIAKAAREEAAKANANTSNGEGVNTGGGSTPSGGTGDGGSNTGNNGSQGGNNEYSEWQSDAQYHWKKRDKSDKARHAYAGALTNNSRCTICGRMVTSYTPMGNPTANTKTDTTTSTTNISKIDTSSKIKEMASKNNLVSTPNITIDINQLLRRQGILPQAADGALVDNSGIAKIHKNEVILTAEQTAFLRNEILSNKPTSLLSLLTDFRDAYNSIPNASDYNTVNNSGVTIEQAIVEMHVAKIANDYDAQRAGEQALEKMVNIARKSAGQNRIGR